LISSLLEYQKAREELEYLVRWLSRLEEERANVNKGFTLASIRKMISRLQEELAEYEAAGTTVPTSPQQQPDSNDREIEREA
jgi:hypothetical protein